MMSLFLEKKNNEFIQNESKVNRILDEIYNQGIDPQELNPDTIIWALETLSDTSVIARAFIEVVEKGNR